MEFREKAKIRIENWMTHNTYHIKEYAQFAEELENSGYNDAALNIRAMAAMAAKCSQCLENALLSMKEES